MESNQKRLNSSFTLLEKNGSIIKSMEDYKTFDVFKNSMKNLNINRFWTILENLPQLWIFNKKTQ